MGLLLTGVGCLWERRVRIIMFGLSLVRHVHGTVGHVYWRSHCGTMSFCGLEFSL